MQATAQETVQRLFNSNVGDTQLIYDFNLFHRSVIQKLWSTDYYYKQLTNIDINEFLVFPSASSTESTGSTTIHAPLLDIPGYCQYLNRLIDGFFMNSRSTLDTFAHQIYTLYESQTLPQRIYITTARDLLLELHPTSKAGGFLNNQLGQRWFTEFEPFRHCTTHESLIRYDDISVVVDPVTYRYKLSRKIKLPDNPQVRPFTYNRNRVVGEYCQSTLRKIHTLVSKVYENVQFDIRRNGDVVPISVT